MVFPLLPVMPMTGSQIADGEKLPVLKRLQAVLHQDNIGGRKILYIYFPVNDKIPHAAVI